MSVRKQCNRYRTEPYGKDREDVIKRAKAFYKDGCFLIHEYKGIYFVQTPSLPPFADPHGSTYYTKRGRKWVATDERPIYF